jgi:sulfite reductase (NADPH) flavoprotein alpha-component
LLSFSGEEPVEVAKVGSLSLREALLHHLTITKLSRKLIASYSTKGQCAPLQQLLTPEHATHLEDYTYGREFIDLLLEYPGVIQEPSEVVALLPKLAPRLYSISSSPTAHSGEVHTTMAVVRYRTCDRERGGVCSTLLGDRVPVGERVPVYIQPNKMFRLPQDSSAPIIMIGPGTGVAPFRSFLHERRALGHSGRNWLFFGERSAATDFLYRDELESMLADGHLSRLDTAFSRDQAHKIYVQDKMFEQAALFWSWLQEGASIYVCGDATRMAKDVHNTLHKIVEQKGNMSTESAADFVEALKDQHRYHRDVY